MMSLGAKGVISVVANIAPQLMVNMTHLCLDGCFEEASKLQITYMDLIDALFLEVNPIPVKAALGLMGRDVGCLLYTSPSPREAQSCHGACRFAGCVQE